MLRNRKEKPNFQTGIQILGRSYLFSDLRFLLSIRNKMIFDSKNT